MKRAIVCILIALVAWGGFAAGKKESAAAAFPEKPIKLMVYTAPGGLIDITARKFTDIAAKFTKATFVVENKAGAGGMVAWEHVLGQPADGYTLFAVTRALITNLVSTDSKIDPFSLDWMALLVDDPECLITGAKSKVLTGQDILADAKARPGQQIWIAPPGMDEYMTYKTWEKAGITGKFVPFDSGAQAMAAVMGGQGQVYVGNPADIAGKPDLKIAVISSEKRLAQFPDVPTFKELGINDLDNESIWRGFAVKKGTPDSVQQWYGDLFEKVTNDPDWRSFFEKNGMTLAHQRKDKFNEMIRSDIAEQKKFLKK
jgi:putative tricarboxylic transport membrane protein